MKFDETDRKDPRILGSLPGWQLYPDDVDCAPITSGVYVLADTGDQVVYIGAAANGNLRMTTMNLVLNKVVCNAVKFRWCVTRDDVSARELASEWEGKYGNGNERET